ncbi:E3 ubiquitin-protein ligase TRIM39-like isoform X2 [Lepisosteus oculatus]|uniref:E3 ubiquitin-protein ligase TRIM39-like isoform X2 n=1 Tax=Lepisosteus oculatus TaxID=7918 RepID=UPI00074011CB|nr:PREDICTED: E3 ubiquitin-protein ligase TRIM39-like isoform X2 [Lepisosteus oculatus]
MVCTGMASPSSLLSEEQFLCSICLDIFNKPVSTSCGHNFCLACIEAYWDSSDVYQCPVCKKAFLARPDLSVNRSLREISEQFKKTRASSAGFPSTKLGWVPCDVCTEKKLKAVKTCLVCLASYCETHIQSHYQGAAFRRHRLIDPVEKLEDRLCEKHEKLLELFCRTDQTCVCQFCTETDHQAHSTVALEEEYREKQTQLRKTEAEVQQMIQDRLKKVEEIKQAVELSKSCAQREIEDSVQVFTALQRHIERSQAELIELIEEKQRAAERKAEGLIKELEQEINLLLWRNIELEKLSHTEDHLHFLQRFPSQSFPLQTKDWANIAVQPDLGLGAIRRVVSQLEERLREEMEKVPEIKFHKARKYAVDVTLNPNTAARWLIVSEDGKQVRYGGTELDLPDNPERFDHCHCVVGKGGFTSGRHYWEVEVGRKTDWDLGVIGESVNRKGQITYKLQNNCWVLCLRNGDKYWANGVIFPLNLKPLKVGVYVDYEEGQVSFYNVEARSHIYTFTDTFTEKLYPFFSPNKHHGGKNAAPLIISPVNYTD